MILKNGYEINEFGKKRRFIKFKCDNCGIEFVPTSDSSEKLKNKNHYCKINCCYEHRNKMTESYKAAPAKHKLNCLSCKQPFEAWTQYNKMQKFCKRDCYMQAKRDGIVPSTFRLDDPSVREKMSISAKKRCATKENCSFYGKHHTEENKKKHSEVMKGLLVGEKNPMYGKTHSDEIRNKMSEIVSQQFVDGKRKAYGKNFHQKGLIFSTKANRELFYRSSWEKQTIEWLDGSSLIKGFEYEPCSIAYQLIEGDRMNKRHYIPDFIVEFVDGHKEMWEIKPKAFFESVKTKLKQAAAEEYCRINLIDSYRLLGKKEVDELSTTYPEFTIDY